MRDPHSLEYVYTKDEFDELARTVDQAKTGRINYLSFLGLFSAAEAGAMLTPAAAAAVATSPSTYGSPASPLLSRTPPVTTAGAVFVEQICATIWSNEVLLSKALRSFDPKSSGAVTPAQFGKALEEMNGALGTPFTPLTADQIERVVTSLPLDVEGRINYKEFVAAFEVHDRLQDT